MMGYEKEMAVLLDANPGLKSRFPSAFHFSDYNDSELAEIFRMLAAKKGVKCNMEALSAAVTVLARKRNESNFGNAREATNLVKQVRLRTIF